jgi:hypothetical protein
MSWKKTLKWLIIFSISMGFLEGAVVVYLRLLYYPEGFSFPLHVIESRTAIVEFLREAATLLMLVSAGMLAGKTGSQRFAWFIFCFGIWDLVYYAVLKIFLNWPPDFFSWDILFLIPVPWTGPVAAPCFLAGTMVIGGAVLSLNKKQITKGEIWLMITGSVIVIYSFIDDYLQYVIRTRSSVWSPVSSQKLFSELEGYVPSQYKWWLFCIGEAFIIYGLFKYLNAAKNRRMLLQEN